MSRKEIGIIKQYLLTRNAKKYWEQRALQAQLNYDDKVAIKASQKIDELTAHIQGGGGYPITYAGKYPLLCDSYQAEAIRMYLNGNNDPILEKLANGAINNLVLAVSMDQGIEKSRVDAYVKHFLSTLSG